LLEIATPRVPVITRSAKTSHCRKSLRAQGACRFTKVTCGSDSPPAGRGGERRRRTPYVGRLSLVRVFLRDHQARHDCSCVGAHFHFSFFFFGASVGPPHNGAGPDSLAGHVDHDEDERIRWRCPSRWASSSGRHRWCCPGDMCAIGRLSPGRKPENTLSDKAQPLVLKPWMMPESLLAGGDSGTCQDRRGQAVGRAGTIGRRGSDAANRAETRRRIRSCCGALGEAHCRRGAGRHSPTGYGVNGGYRRATGCRCEKTFGGKGERPRPACQTVRWTTGQYAGVATSRSNR